MTQKRMERIVRRRKAAQGFGALGGVLTVFAVLGVVYGEDMKNEAEKLVTEAQDKVPGKAKELLADAKSKLGM